MKWAWVAAVVLAGGGALGAITRTPAEAKPENLLVGKWLCAFDRAEVEGETTLDVSAGHTLDMVVSLNQSLNGMKLHLTKTSHYTWDLGDGALQLKRKSSLPAQASLNGKPAPAIVQKMVAEKLDGDDGPGHNPHYPLKSLTRSELQYETRGGVVSCKRT